MSTISKSARIRASASKHASRGWTCTLCGKRVYGNGGKSSHQKAHKREAGFLHEPFWFIEFNLDSRAMAIEFKLGIDRYGNPA